MRRAALSLTVLAASCAATEGDGDATAPLPNIVLVYADDLGYGDLAFLNPDSKIPTPHLDRLAREGLAFTDAHSSSGICTPSRYALLTGRHHWRDFHGIVQSFGASVLPDDRLTLPEMLRERGYATACIGKWHLGWDWEALRVAGSPGDKGGARPGDFDWSRAVPDGPLAHGFDHYFGDDVPNFPPYAWIEDDHLPVAPTVPYVPEPRPAEGSHEGRPGPMVEGWRLDAVMPELADRAAAWIDGRAGDERPFFLYFPWTSPHAPIVPAADWQGRTGAGPYGDFVAQSDAALGEVLEALERNGFAENTLVVFTSDNGPEHYAYARAGRHEHRSMGSLRGLKRDLFEGGHRVPMLVHWPGRVAPGGVSHELVSQVDLMATLAALLDYDLPAAAAEDSHDLSDLWLGRPGARGRDFHVHNTRKDQYALREGSWLYLDAPSGHHTRLPADFAQANDFQPLEGPALFDLASDPGQRRNLITEDPERARALAERLAELRERGHSAPRLGGDPGH